MKKILFLILFVGIVVLVAWRHLPVEMRQKGAAFVGIALKRDGQEFKKFVEDAVIPQSSEKRREVLIKELKSNIQEIKRQVAPPYKGENPTAFSSESVLQQKESEKNDLARPDAKSADNSPFGEVTKELIIRSEKVIQELEKVNNDNGLQREVASRVLDKILPSKEELTDCVSDGKTK